MKEIKTENGYALPIFACYMELKFCIWAWTMSYRLWVIYLRTIMIPMYRLWLHGLYVPRCPLSPERPLNLSQCNSFKGFQLLSSNLVRWCYDSTTKQIAIKDTHARPLVCVPQNVENSHDKWMKMTFNWGSQVAVTKGLFIKSVIAVAAYIRLASWSQAKFHDKRNWVSFPPSCAAAPAQSMASAYLSLQFSPHLCAVLLWNFTWDRLASGMYAATATPFHIYEDTSYTNNGLGSTDSKVQLLIKIRFFLSCHFSKHGTEFLN